MIGAVVVVVVSSFDSVNLSSYKCVAIYFIIDIISNMIVVVVDVVVVVASFD